MGAPEFLVVCDRRFESVVVDLLEQPPSQHERVLVGGGRVQQRRLASGHAFGFGYLVGDELVFFRIGVYRAAVAANGKCVHKGGIRRALHGLE